MITCPRTTLLGPAFILIVLSLAGCSASASRHSHVMDIPPAVLAAEAAQRQIKVDRKLESLLTKDPRRLFDALDAAVCKKVDDKPANNDTGSMAWSEAHIMSSYMTMYEATGDIDYLHRLAARADRVLAGRDDLRGVADYRSVSDAGWRTFRYQTSAAPYRYVVHSAMLTYPMARFAAIVRDDEELARSTTADGTTLGRKAATYIQRVKETIESHEWQWKNGPQPGEGYYRTPLDAPPPLNPGRNLPWNQQNAMGRTLLAMYDATGQQKYLKKAEKLAALFRRFLWRHGDSYVWQIRNDLDATSIDGCGEDISHASINIDFAVSARRAGIVFSNNSLRTLAGTFRQNVLRSDGACWANVTGCGEIGEYDHAIGRWLVLTPWDDGTIYAAALESMRDVIEGRAKPREVHLPAVANLIYWSQHAR